jgi:hypothetical protein
MPHFFKGIRSFGILPCQNFLSPATGKVVLGDKGRVEDSPEETVTM